MGSERSRYRGFFVPQGADTAEKVHGYVNGESQAKVVGSDIKVISVVS